MQRPCACCGVAHLTRALVQNLAQHLLVLGAVGQLLTSAVAQHILPELLFKNLAQQLLVAHLFRALGQALRSTSCPSSCSKLMLYAHAAAQRVPHVAPRLVSWSLFFCLEWAREVSRACASSKESVAPLTQRQLASSRGGSSERPSCSAQPRQGGLAGGAAGGSARSGYSERPGIGGSRTRKRPAPDAESHGSSFSDEGDSSSGSDSDSEKSAAAGSAGKPLKCDIYDLSTGLSEEHSSMTSAARSLGITSQNVGKAMKKGTLIKSKYAVAARGGEVHDAAIAAFNRIKGKRSRETPV